MHKLIFLTIILYFTTANCVNFDKVAEKVRLTLPGIAEHVFFTKTTKTVFNQTFNHLGYPDSPVKTNNSIIMKEIMLALKNIQKELDEQKSEIRKRVDKVSERVTQNINKLLDEELFKLQDQHDKLKKKVDSQEKRRSFSKNRQDNEM